MFELFCVITFKAEGLKEKHNENEKLNGTLKRQELFRFSNNV
jgi:hypothetical protein